MRFRNTFYSWKLYPMALVVILLALLVAACPAGDNSSTAGNGGSSAYRYACANGTGIDATFDALSDASAPMRCQACNSGYRLIDEACFFLYRSNCANGTGIESTTDITSQNRCGECNTGWRLLADASCNPLCSESGGTYTLEATADGGAAINFRMITVPVGMGLNFFTGINDDDDVTVDAPYSIAETELTYAVWRRVRDWATDNARGDTAYELRLGRAGSEGNDGGTGDGSNDHPVTRISWYDSIKFTNALSEYCRLTPVYLNGNAVMRSGTTAPRIDTAANGFRLPTNSEWELAARYINDANNDGDIKDMGEYYPGNYASGATDSTSDATATGAVAWYNTNSGLRTHPIREKNVNSLNLYDMNGNVWELTIGAPPGYLAFSGGSWINGLEDMRVSRVTDLNFNFISSTIGFRLAR